jgi:PKD repeat protein
MDKRIIIVIASVIAIAIGFILFKKLGSKKPTVEVQIETNLRNKTTYIDSLVVFTDKTAGATSWIWNFGDGGAIGQKREETHTYAEAGKYKVILQMTGSFGTVSDSSLTIIVENGADAVVPDSVKPAPIAEPVKPVEPVKPIVNPVPKPNLAPKPNPTPKPLPKPSKPRHKSGAGHAEKPVQIEELKPRERIEIKIPK